VPRSRTSHFSNMHTPTIKDDVSCQKVPVRRALWRGSQSTGRMGQCHFLLDPTQDARPSVCGQELADHAWFAKHSLLWYTARN